MERPSVRSYSIRGSRITDAQRMAKDALQQVHGIEFKQEQINIPEIFPTSEKVIMEIGFGMGEATAIIAKNHPNNGYIAVDVHPPGIGKLLARIVENDLPKKKHNKRRIVNESFLSLIHPKIKTGGFIHIATDWVPYAHSIQEVFAGSTLFTGGVIEKPEWRPVTRFEGQGIDKDHAVNDMMYTKV